MRYALYYTPLAGSPLEAAGARWLGRSVLRGTACARPQLSGVDLAAITTHPERYGLHGTLTAPLHLNESVTEAELLKGAFELASQFSPFTLPPLRVARLGSFLALVPENTSPSLNGLAEACVRHIASIRKPLSEAEIARRNPDSLTARQLENLHQWGYPYVMADYRFHITLTDGLDDALAELVRPQAENHFQEALKTPEVVSHISLFIEPEPKAPFEFHSHVPLGANA